MEVNRGKTVVTKILKHANEYETKHPRCSKKVTTALNHHIRRDAKVPVEYWTKSKMVAVLGQFKVAFEVRGLKNVKSLQEPRPFARHKTA